MRPLCRVSGGYDDVWAGLNCELTFKMFRDIRTRLGDIADILLTAFNHIQK
jgi:hypothetical protein